MLAQQLQTVLLGRIPLDPIASYASDHGLPFVHSHPESPASEAIQSIVDKIVNSIEQK